MKNYNDEYFFIGLAEISNSPMLTLDDDFVEDYAIPFLHARPIKYSELIRLKFSEPVPRKPKMVDYHSFSTPSPVVSEKLKSAIEATQAKEVQFVPVLIRDKSDDLIEGYSVIKICKSINCANMEESKYNLALNGKILSFDKLVLDNDKLDEIPLEDRLIFAVGEKKTYIAYHISVIEKMLATEPVGMNVYRVSGWDPGLPFREIYDEYLKGLSE